jgi:Domain of unknown function (DUF6894)
MPIFYFDTHHGDGITIDDEGLDFVDAVAAEKQALEALAQAILDDARKHKTGITKVEVRDTASRVVLTASAVVSILRSQP